ncbi:LapA family protein [Pseudomonas yamanorum]|uniref:LapA family protein n=1 Tax=Pseudomonas yamanorum TaxID=515393 RepID=UPI0015A20A98|nr:LapA family protein [Pseudomonas yamanorum]NWD23859.1 LapA family protein [Pseudomonas yamanorum]
MRGVKRFAVVLTVVVVTLSVLAFVLENQQAVSLSFFGWATGQMPVSVVVVGALIVGMLVGPLLSLLVGGRKHRSIPVGRV